MLSRFSPFDVQVFSKDEVFNDGLRAPLASGYINKHEALEHSRFIYGTSTNVNHQKVVEFFPEQNSFATEDGSVHQYQVLVLADELEFDYNYLPGLNQAVHNSQSSVNGLSDLDLCYKQSKYHGKSYLSNKSLYYAHQNSSRNLHYDGQVGLLNHALNTSALNHNLRNSKLDVNPHIQMVSNGKWKINSFLQSSLNLHGLVNTTDNWELKSVDYNSRTAHFVETNSGKSHALHYDNLVVQPELKLKSLYGKFATPEGHLDLDAGSLQHNSFKNVFALGPMLHAHQYSAEGAQTQSAVVASNVDDYLNFIAPRVKYNGHYRYPVYRDRYVLEGSNQTEVESTKLNDSDWESYMDTQVQAFYEASLGLRWGWFDRLNADRDTFNPSAEDVAADHSLFRREGENYIKFYEDEQYRKIREAQFQSWSELKAHTNDYNVVDLSNHYQSTILAKNYKGHRYSFPDQEGFPQ